MARDFRPKDKSGSKPASNAPRSNHDSNDARRPSFNKNGDTKDARRPSSNKSDRDHRDKGSSSFKGKGIGRDLPGSNGAAESNGKQRGAPSGVSSKYAQVERRTGLEEEVGQSSFADFSAKTIAGAASAGAAKGKMILEPRPEWMSMEPKALPAASKRSKEDAKPTQADMEAAHERGERILLQENQRYSALLYGTNTGKNHSGKEAAQLGELGSLTPSDARFIASLLSSEPSASGSGSSSGATLSDRISALTLLVQSSPLHNLTALDRLFGMCRKKNRQESGKATRSLADWLASPGGLGPPAAQGGRKLRYFRDQPMLPHLLSLLVNDAPSASASASAIDQHLALFVFEDRLKKYYFHFLQLLETQSHDTLPFVRQGAVSQLFHLLRDQSEQEQNLLRLIVNKLGDGERSVASRASGHLLELLSAHPAMKTIVIREVAQLILQSPAVHSSQAQKAQQGKKDAAEKDSSKVNLHANYYGILTLNQTMLTSKDTAVANMLVELYFDLFETLLSQQAHVDKDEKRKIGGDAAKEEEEDAAATGGGDGAAAAGKKKQRWRDGGKKAKGNIRPKSALGIDEAHAKMVAAILTGVRRAMPFAELGNDVFDKHLDTLFRVTHSGSFNISIQALQLIFHVTLASKKTGVAAGSSSTPLADRFYRTLYDSLLDARLAVSSKQAMYLNLLFRSIKADEDANRVKAFAKRLCQVLNMHDPPFICGALFLLAELVKLDLGLKGMLNDPEEEDELEHFVDVDDEAEDQEEEQDKRTHSFALQARPNAVSYDGRKRDPRFAGAQVTCLWDLLPLTQHYHPSVAVSAMQLLQSQRVTSAADLSLHTLSHFLDRFVYRNPKKNPSAHKGSSIMQPAEAAASSQRGVAAGLEMGVVQMRGNAAVAKRDQVQSDAFRERQEDEVDPDQKFFHRFFTQKKARELDQTNDAKKPKRSSDAEEDGESELDEEALVKKAGGGDDEEDESDMSEGEIWKAMKASMPGRDDDLALSSDDEEDDEDLAQYDYSDSDEDGDDADAPDGQINLVEGFDDDEEDDEEAQEDGRDFAAGLSADEDEPGDATLFDESDDDLLPFAKFEEESGADNASQPASMKRSAAEAEDQAEGEQGLSKSQQRRRNKKQRKELPVFASAEDYEHMLGGSDDEGEDVKL